MRRSPKPGALTAATLRPPRSLLTTKVANAFAFDVFCDDEERTSPTARTCFEHRKQRLQGGQFLLVQEGCTDRRARPPSSRCWSRSRARGSRGRTACPRPRRVRLRDRFGLLDRDDAFLADFFHRRGRSCRRFPDRHWRRSCRPGQSVQLVETPVERRSMLLHDGISREVDTALEVHRVHAGSHTALQPSRERWPAARTVAVVVPSPATSLVLDVDFPHHLGAHVLEACLQARFPWRRLHRPW